MSLGYQPSEEEINDYGSMLATSDFGGAILGSSLLAIQMFVVLSGLSIFFATPKDKRKGRLRFVIIGCVILVTSSVDVLLDVWRAYRVLFTGGPTGRSYLQSITGFWADNAKIILVGDVMLCITIAAADLLMLWRCWVLWKNKKWVMVLPTLACIGTIVCNPIYVASNTIPDGGGIDAQKAILVSACLSVAMNIMVTFLILFRLVTAWLALKKAIPDRNHPGIYSHAAAVIIESAAPLTVFGIGFIIATALNSFPFADILRERGKRTVAVDIFSWLYYSFCALSPQLIIFRVTTGQSWKGSVDSDEGAAMFSRPIQFADAVAYTKASISTGSV